jgi:hypothetical protein
MRYLLAFGISIVAALGHMAWGQQQISIKPSRPVICYQSFKNRPAHVPAPVKFQTWKQGRSETKQTATFDVKYFDFPADNKAKDAFQYAVDIWETELVSPVTIHIEAHWGTLSTGVLGQAIWGTAIANFAGAQQVNTFYPVALAEKMAGRDLNPSTDPDIVATFSSSVNWYFGTDGNTPAGKMDMVTIVLHEIAHGLGFTDTYSVDNTLGSVGFANGSQYVPFVFDLSVENQTGLNFFSGVVSPSTTMKTQLTSNSVYYNAPWVTGMEGHVRPRLYAPTTFNSGSSISHLDEATYTTPANNSLMTPQIDFAESIHDPGPILRDMFIEMGWINTRIAHEPQKDTERMDGAPYPITALIVSDTVYDPASVKLHYTVDNVHFTEVVMTPTGTENEFSASLPGRTSPGGYGYFITVVDTLTRTFTNPGKLREQNNPATQSLIVFNIGQDTAPPQIVHTPADYLWQGTTTLPISALITDNMGVDHASLQYTIKGGSPQTIALQKSPTVDDTFTADIPLPSDLTIGDKIEYKITAVDVSSHANQGTAPATGNYSVAITGILPTRDSYVNDFNQPSADFIGSSFHITTPTGFADGSANSDHPYANGSGTNDESNYTFQLQIPIRLMSTNPYIQFDEIVLVEPGEPGSKFGDQDFYDYAIVEGSKDGGTTWKPFLDGYDARSNSAWLTRYQSNINNDNSQALGDPTLYRKRTINMLKSGYFLSSDVILIRFRLFADQGSHGWGWSIDNLSVQGPVTSIEPTTPETAFHVYPNPVKGDLTLEYATAETDAMDVEILSLQGKSIHAFRAHAPFNVKVDMSLHQDGLYIVKTTVDGKVIVRKFVKLTH